MLALDWPLFLLHQCCVFQWYIINTIDRALPRRSCRRQPTSRRRSLQSLIVMTLTEHSCSQSVKTDPFVLALYLHWISAGGWFIGLSQNVSYWGLHCSVSYVIYQSMKPGYETSRSSVVQKWRTAEVNPIPWEKCTMGLADWPIAFWLNCTIQNKGSYRSAKSHEIFVFVCKNMSNYDCTHCSDHWMEQWVQLTLATSQHCTVFFWRH